MIRPMITQIVRSPGGIKAGGRGYQVTRKPLHCLYCFAGCNVVTRKVSEFPFGSSLSRRDFIDVISGGKYSLLFSWANVEV